MRWLAVLLAVLALPACREAPVEPSLRARLGPPMVALAQALGRAEEMADSARYRVERGEAMREALALLRGTLDDVRSQAGELAHSAMGMREPQAAAIARQSVDLALLAADDADQEIAVLAPLVDADTLMDQAVASWQATPDVALAGRLEQVAAQMASITVRPEQCRALWDNRARWAELVATRTERLVQDGAERDGYLANPFGEDRRTADAADRDCWRRHGALPRATADLYPLVERFSELTRVTEPAAPQE